MLVLSKRKSWESLAENGGAFLPKSSLLEGEMAVGGVDVDPISLLKLAVEDLQT